MSEPVKLRYEIALDRAMPPEVIDGVSVRPISAPDRDSLAELMLNAYVGTIDYEGETFDDAAEEVDSWFRSGASLLDHSFCAVVGEQIASAVLVSEFESMPFIGYVMTRADHKGRGLAEVVTRTALTSLSDAGHQRVVFYITDGNAASERLFARLGATGTIEP